MDLNYYLKLLLKKPKILYMLYVVHNVDSTGNKRALLNYIMSKYLIITCIIFFLLNGLLDILILTNPIYRSGSDYSGLKQRS